MTETDTLAARIDALEIRMVHQDQTIEDLNVTITDQWKQIEDLAYRVNRLSDELRAAENSAGVGEEPEAPPPHY
jgi:SlyX protein